MLPHASPTTPGAVRILGALALLGALSYCGALSTRARAFDPLSGDLDKSAPARQIRALTYNVAGNFAADPPTTAPLRRVLAAIDPDLIAFQEIAHDLGDGDPEAAAALMVAALEAMLPPGPWRVWVGETDGHSRNALASRFALSMTIRDTIPASDIRGVTAALVDLPDARFGETDLYVMNVHMKAEDSPATSAADARRQKHADAIANWIRDARTVGCMYCPEGEQIDLPGLTPILILGDFNLFTPDRPDRAPYHATRTLLEGDIYDETAYGIDAAPDWDNSPIADAAPWDPTNGDPDTYPRAGTPADRLDRFLYTDSVLRVANRAILDTANLSPTALAALGLQATDTGTTTSDHLPVFVDFELGPEPAAGRLLINEFLYNDEDIDDRNFLEIVDVGGRPVNLDAPTDFLLLRSDSGLPTDVPTTETEASRYDLNGVVPPGGVFVIYSPGGQSSAIAPRIEANLPDPLQRQARPFLLTNGSNTGIALVATEDGETDRALDAYLYEDSTDDGDHYFLTKQGLPIPFTAAQRSSLRIPVTGDDRSFARNPGRAAPNDLAHWTVLTSETAGLANQPRPPKSVWIVH